MIHSVPDFPPPSHLSYSYPDSALKHAHIHLCISLRIEEIDDIATQLLYTAPYIYDQSVPDSMRPDDLERALQHKQVDHMVRRSKFRQEFISAGGQEFMYFAKSMKFQGDIYDSWLIPYYRSDFFAHCGKEVSDQIPSLCRTTFKVLNVQKIKIGNVEFPATDDHSKWAITPANHYVCIGDVDRSRRGMTHGGGMMCFRDVKIWKQFDHMIVSTEQCKHEKDEL